jgi:hypothetical protein
MSKTQMSSVSSEEVLYVERKWSFLPTIPTPTYDQYVQRWVTMPEREGFHLLTRSSMKELIETVKWMVLHDKWKKHVLFKIRVDTLCLDHKLSTHTQRVHERLDPHTHRKDTFF